LAIIQILSFCSVPLKIIDSSQTHHQSVLTRIIGNCQKPAAPAQSRKKLDIKDVLTENGGGSVLSSLSANASFLSQLGKNILKDLEKNKNCCLTFKSLKGFKCDAKIT
jgi:hypothetical protein